MKYRVDGIDHTSVETAMAIIGTRVRGAATREAFTIECIPGDWVVHWGACYGGYTVDCHSLDEAIEKAIKIARRPTHGPGEILISGPESDYKARTVAWWNLRRTGSARRT